MSLLQISEPGGMDDSTAAPEPKRVVGIDLGTTNSLVASQLPEQTQVTVLVDELGQALLPSVVYYQAAQPPLVGRLAQAYASEDPHNCIASVKRLMGRAVADTRLLADQLPYEFSAQSQGMLKIVTAAGDLSPVQVSADILASLKARAEQQLGGSLAGAVITVPAYFDDAQRQATKDAATLVDLKVMRLLNEPTAAAIAYGLDQGKEGVIAVYDLGGGTFDISILRLHKGLFEVLATGGDSALGGDDFDHLLAEWLLEQAGHTTRLTPLQHRGLLMLAKQLKEQLFTEHEVALDLTELDIDWQGRLSRAQMGEILDPLIDKTLNACQRTLLDAEVEVTQVQEVVMVGGSTRTLRVRERVAQLFQRPVLSDIDPDQVVAIGAGLQAEQLAGNQAQSALLLDVIPLSLGLETMGGLMEKVIHRNTTIPVARAQEFTTFKDGQTAMSIHVLQGERELVKDCRSLARFELTGIPPLPAGAAKVRVGFRVDADGLLGVSAEEVHSGVQASIEVKPSYGLSDAEITQMLQASIEHAGADVQERKLLEYRVDADRLLEALGSALEKDGARLLSSTELEQLQAEMHNLSQLRDSADAETLRQAIENANQASDEFAARRMDDGIKQALKGQSLAQIDDQQKD